MSFPRTALFICCILFGLVFFPCSWTAGQMQPTASSAAAAPDAAAPLSGGQMADIHDIKAPERLTFNPAWRWYGFLFFLGILLVLAARMAWKKKGGRGTAQRLSVLRSPPEETACKRLGEILPLMDADGKKFYFSLSLIIRGYIQERFGIPAPELTTEELVPAVNALDLDRALKDGLRSLFAASDPVKYAAAPAVRKEMEAHAAFVRNFIKQTTPVPEKASRDDGMNPPEGNGFPL